MPSLSQSFDLLASPSTRSTRAHTRTSTTSRPSTWKLPSAPGVAAMSCLKVTGTQADDLLRASRCGREGRGRGRGRGSGAGQGGAGWGGEQEKAVAEE